MAMTVLGPVPADRLGVTLIHEHLHMDSRHLVAEHGYEQSEHGAFDSIVATEARWNPGVHPANYDLTDSDVVIEELAGFRSRGGQTIVDATPVDLGRSAQDLVKIAQATGLNVVMGCGYYLEASHRKLISDHTVEHIAAGIVNECTRGVGGTGVRPGLIGEIGTNNPMTASEERVLRAAGLAAIATGRVVSVHVHPWGREGIKIINVLAETGVAPDRVILNHMNTAAFDRPYQEELLQRGVYLAYDLFGFDHSLLGAGRYPPSDYAVASTVADLYGSGMGSQLLISQDIGVRTRLSRYGGWGYHHLLDHVVPLLRSFGLHSSDIGRLLVDNPARALSIPGTLS